MIIFNPNLRPDFLGLYKIIKRYKLNNFDL